MRQACSQLLPCIEIALFPEHITDQSSIYNGHGQAMNTQNNVYIYGDLHKLNKLTKDASKCL